jgi:hypothetical protein
MKKTKSKRGLAKPKKLVGHQNQALEALTECGCHDAGCRSRGAGGIDVGDDILF